jgi:hypothetical protein
MRTQQLPETTVAHRLIRVPQIRDRQIRVPRMPAKTPEKMPDKTPAVTMPE